MLRPTIGNIVGILLTVVLFQIALLIYDLTRSKGNPPCTAQEHQQRYGGTQVTISQPSTERVKATFVILCRNSDIEGLKQSIGQLESRFNSRYNYPYTFLNDVPFTEEFKRAVSQLSNSTMQFGLIPKEAWGMPKWINRKKAKETRVAMKDVIYGGSRSYRLMCRFNSGFFFRHPLLKGFEYYWRVEPDVQFTSTIPYDPFLFMKTNDLVYGFTIMLKEYQDTIPTLWNTTKQFMEDYKHLVPQQNSMAMLQDGENYNLCHFWSNFEIARLDFFNSKEYLAYFDYLDRAGGFFYERWGDAPVHTLGLAMFLSPEKIHFFEDIGYEHDPYNNCPSNPIHLLYADCDPKKSVNRNNQCIRKYRETRFGNEL